MCSIKKINLLCIWVQIIYMVGHSVNIYYIVDLNGQHKKKLISFEKNLFKLMNNSVYGKTMGNLRKRINIR